MSCVQTLAFLPQPVKELSVNSVTQSASSCSWDHFFNPYFCVFENYHPVCYWAMLSNVMNWASFISFSLCHPVRIAELEVSDENDVNWDLLAEGWSSVRSPQWLRSKWWTIKRQIANHKEVSFSGKVLIHILFHYLFEKSPSLLKSWINKDVENPRREKKKIWIYEIVYAVALFLVNSESSWYIASLKSLSFSFSSAAC